MTTEMTIEQIAEVCHEVNREYCEFLGDYSIKPWEDAEDNIKGSAVDGVKFRIDFPTVSPQEMHFNWSKFKLADGWKYGPVKDVELKTHPCLVEYKDLPEDQKAKDYIFSSVVGALSKYVVF